MRSKFKWIFTLLIAFSMQFSFAQEKTVTGTVTDNGMPLSGANVRNSAGGGVSTDADGKFAIKAKSGDKLTVSYKGYESQTVAVGSSNNYTVKMKQATEILQDVVVVAYGAQKKEALTGSVSEVKSKEVAKITTGNVTQGLVGKVAGVQVFNNNGMPGDAPIIRMRGIGSINASAAPLYVVDGVPFNGDVASINSQDIESMSFLKDAAAAALYGNRGANGVIIITTKKGKKQKSVVTIDSRTGFSSRAVKDYDLMTGSREYYEAYFKALKNTYMYTGSGMSASQASSQAASNLINGSQGLGYNVYNVSNNQLINPVTGLLNTSARLLYQEDWNDYLFGDGFFTQTYFSVAGGDEDSNRFFSVGYEKNEGYVVNSGLEKITARLKVDNKISSWLKLGSNVSYTHILQNYLDGYTGGSTYSSPFFWVRGIAPIYPVHAYDTAGNMLYGANGSALFDDGTGMGGLSPIRPYASLQNPYATAINDIKNWQTDNLFASGYAEFKIFKGLSFTYSITGDLFNQNDRSLDTPLYGDAVNAGGRVSYSNSRTFAFTQQQLFKYVKKYNSHNFELLAGHETLDRRSDVVGAERSKLLLPDSPYVNQASVLQGNDGYGTSYALEGFLSRFTYDFANKYFLNASIRRDGSSRFHPDNRWGTFYGLGGAWRISQENFLKNISWLNEFKLKASYGQQGNDDLGIELPYMNQYEVSVTTDTSLPISYNLVALGNKNITWETNTNFNAGFDLAMFKNRLSIDAEYFERKVSDMLFQKPLPISSGFASIPENIGDMQNSGFEVTLTYDLIRNKSFNLSLFGNATHYKNKITSLPYNGRLNNNIISGNFIREEGGGIYDYYMREFAGVNPSTGAALFWMDDASNPENRVVTENYSQATLYRIGKTAIPDVYGGFGFSANYKGFDMDMNFAYQLGGYSFDGVWLGMLSLSPGQNLHRDFNSTWTIDNPNASLPRVDVDDPLNYYSTSTLGLIKSDYLSLQSVSLGYSLGNKTVNQLGLSNLRFYALTDNVALWSKRKGFDPRLGGVTGSSDNKYSILRTISIGVNVQF